MKGDGIGGELHLLHKKTRALTLTSVILQNIQKILLDYAYYIFIEK